jgi:predicted dehydrogenase
MNLPSTHRRGFLAGSAVAGFAFIDPRLVRGSRVNEQVTFGLIGCGGRGGWIADLFEKSGKYRCVACADYYDDRATGVADRFKIEPSRRFTGLAGYQRLLAQSLDAVVIETPPYFHPAQAAAAVEAGKHVYVAKPIAVDVPGCHSIEASGQAAIRKGLAFLVDFQTRTNPIFQEAAKRVHAGAIGKPISGEASYLWSMIVHPDAAAPEDRLRTWYQSRALSGDAVVEQDIHALDVATWLLDAAPVRAFGTGGRAVRKHGETWDHFGVTFLFPNDVHIAYVSQKGVPGIPDEIRCRIFGTDGVVDSDYSGRVGITGKNPYPGGRSPNIYAEGANANIETFYNQISGHQFENPTVAPSVRSNLTCILGRNAAYAGGREVTWDDMIRAAEPLVPDLSGLKS